MSAHYLPELALLLAKNDSYLLDGKLNKNKVAELAHKYDSELINLLASHKKLRDLFFVQADSNVLVFNKDTFIRFIGNKEFLPDSYTAYKNKIGLAAGAELLSENKDVVLNWAYKDCVLEGGQDKEDAKRDEIFHNTILAPDQIDRLLDRKALSGFKRYDQAGEHEVTAIKGNDNLIIRGNNLLALHSLKSRYAGRIKLIYIDPPFNTGDDNFSYNDKFSHSTWLTFMRNRLEVARQLLRSDGLIIMHIDQDEGHYLKVLADEIFDRDNFRNEMIWSYRTGGASKTTTLPKKHDVLLSYAKSDEFLFSNIYERQYLEKSFMGSKQDNEGKYYVDTLLRDVFEGVIVSYQGEKRKEYNVRPVLNLSKERVEDFASQKPEGLMRLLLDITVKPGDIVLDYHLGSGTMAAAAHKMGLQYIGIEQLDYGENDPVRRLQDVISGDASGISKDVGWTGGGSFVYCHLLDLGNKFITKVKNARTDKVLIDLLDQAKKSSFLSYKVDPEKINPGDKDFRDLSLAHKKQLLLELVDHNHLYVNYSEIDDSDYGVTAEDKKLNNQFYAK